MAGSHNSNGNGGGDVDTPTRRGSGNVSSQQRSSKSSGASSSHRSSSSSQHNQSQTSRSLRPQRSDLSHSNASSQHSHSHSSAAAARTRSRSRSLTNVPSSTNVRNVNVHTTAGANLGGGISAGPSTSSHSSSRYHGGYPHAGSGNAAGGRKSQIHPAAMEFFSDDICGAVNCKHHASFLDRGVIGSGSGSSSNVGMGMDVASTVDKFAANAAVGSASFGRQQLQQGSPSRSSRQDPHSSSFFSTKYKSNSSALRQQSHPESSKKPPTSKSMSPGTTTTTSSASLSLSKLGPVLLDFRIVLPGNIATASNTNTNTNTSSHIDRIHHHRHPFHGRTIQLQTFAISRGIPALGTGIASTCLSFRNKPHIFANDATTIDTLQAATGLTTGALCIHTLRNVQDHLPPSYTYFRERENGKNGTTMTPEDQDSQHGRDHDDDDDDGGYQYYDEDEPYHEWNVLDSAKSEDASVSYFSHYQPRHHRRASSVAWRPSGGGGGGGGPGSGSGASNSRHVAIGLMGSSSGGMDRDHHREKGGDHHHHHHRGGGGLSGDSYRSTALHAGSGGMDYGKERDYCALVWDVEASASGSATSKGVKQVPIHKLAHNSGVASLAWMSDGQLLAVGCTQRNIQVYDLRIQGTSSPPISAPAHENAVHGIAVDPSSDKTFATFSRGLAEPVKLWDMRNMDSCVAEIKMYSKQAGAGNQLASHDLPNVSAVAWDISSPGSSTGSGMLSVALGDCVRYYDTRVNPSRPSLVRMTNSMNSIQAVAFRPSSTKYRKGLDRGGGSGGNVTSTSSSHRMFVVEQGGTVRDLPLHQVAPVAISPRDGRISNSVGSDVWVGETTEGPTAMESTSYDIQEDVSQVMMRRARCLHVARYSTDASSNLQMIDLELKTIREQTKHDSDDVNLETTIYSREQLWRLWSWIERVEELCNRSDEDLLGDERRFPAKGLRDAGILEVLKIGTVDKDESFIKSPLFNRNIYRSPLRRYVSAACGWVDKSGTEEVLSQIESLGHFERSAALAVWNSKIDEAVSTLQRGADLMRNNSPETSRNLRYAETLELVAMCVAGYSGENKPESSAGNVWKRACKSLLKRPDLSIGKSTHSKRGAYLRAICIFLLNAADTEPDFQSTLDDKHLSLSDRCAFATIFLSRNDLKEFLRSKVHSCIEAGNLEGIIITGLDRRGIALLQSYVDRFSDVQTAALVSSRVIFPQTHFWTRERMVCEEWLEAYREMLNKWQMWQSRAMFDVGRAELLRKIRERQQAEEKGGIGMKNKNLRRQNRTDSLQAFPPQLHFRCNFCNKSHPLSELIRGQGGKFQGIANDWLSRQNPILSCCPNSQCRKPLPRCAICLLPMGCLNLYLELRKHGLTNVDDLSELSSLPFAEWFTWCMKCKHGGHSHHVKDWFKDHDTCPVSNCDCRCQFDGIQKLKRIGLPKT